MKWETESIITDDTEKYESYFRIYVFLGYDGIWEVKSDEVNLSLSESRILRNLAKNHEHNWHLRFVQYKTLRLFSIFCTRVAKMFDYELRK